MKTIRKIFALGSLDNTLSCSESRARVRREPVCELLEGRQLLSTAASTAASGTPPWGDWGSSHGWSGSAPTAAEIAHFDAKGWHGGDAKGAADFAHHGEHGSFTPKDMSATWSWKGTSTS